MRRKTLCALLSSAVAVALLATACYSPYDDYYVPLTDPALATGGSGGTGGGTTTVEPGCIPVKSPDPVRDDCGVFVSASSGSDDNDGSQGKPLATIGKALASPKSGPVYLCAETFTEAVQIKSVATINGGLDCANSWKYIGGAKKSEITSEAGEVPLVLDPGVGAVFEDVLFRAKDAIDSGGSSIAVIATIGAELSLTRCDVEVGIAKDGAAGEAIAMSATAGAMGKEGGDACSDANVVGGGSVQNACEEADINDNSISGKGGSSDEFSGGDGSKGSPGTTDNRGLGEDAAACAVGTVGDSGTSGTAAGGATGIGAINAQGYSGVAGNAGEKGKPGQGGGGGGGAKGGAGAKKCTDAAMAGGASGASGGAGGCGGAGGKGGQAGGASIGMVSLEAKLTFEDVKITAKNGGNGGNGGVGQLGGDGGNGGIGGALPAGATDLKSGCAGGKGGTGGSGGKGGGGIGGHSIGIAYSGEAPAADGATIITAGAGNGGLGEGDTGTGAAGVAQQVQAF